MQPLIALVDCQAFYVSCEILFRPDLIGKPVAVMSSNDACLVALNQAVKELGIKRGVPVFQIQDLIERYQIQLFSSNFSLYADLSARVMATLEEFAPCLEIYSCDEAFLDLTGVCHGNSVAYGHKIRKTVLRSTGIPVCVGLGPTKTLAKLAGFGAKKIKKTDGVLDLSDPVRREKFMKIVPVGEVWGIGSRTAAKLNQLGIYTVLDLARQPSQRLQAQININVARTVMELNGTPCLELEDTAPDKQQIICSRSFSRRITTYLELSQALAEFCSRAAEKLRRQQSVARGITVFIRTNPFNPKEPQYQRTATVKLPAPTQDTRLIIGTANGMLKEIFREGYPYHKCGVQLSHFQPQSSSGQLDLFKVSSQQGPTENKLLMTTMDQINRRFPKAISLAATGFEKAWTPKSEQISPRYTTNWQELVTVKCG